MQQAGLPKSERSNNKKPSHFISPVSDHESPSSGVLPARRMSNEEYNNCIKEAYKKVADQHDNANTISGMKALYNSVLDS